MTAIREYRSCRDEALKLDTQARQSGNIGRYLASAGLLEKCETELGSGGADVAVDERTRAYALSIQNYLKGGDVTKASANLEEFKQAFPGKDLYYADGSSFIETMEVLLAKKEVESRYAWLNVSENLKKEMRRKSHWTRK
jgi:hypothetical protein